MAKAKVFSSQAEYMKHWRMENAAKISAYNKEYAQKNKEKIDEKRAVRIILNKEKYNKKHKEWILLNKNEIREYNKNYTAKRYHSDPVYKLKLTIRNRARLALKGIYKCAKTELLLGCSYEQFKEHIESKFVDEMSWSNMEKWHIDHIKPLSSFDLSNSEHQKIAFHYTNQQPLWAIDNLKKGAKCE